jgi:hypothetical protein
LFLGGQEGGRENIQEIDRRDSEGRKANSTIRVA